MSKISSEHHNFCFTQKWCGGNIKITDPLEFRTSQSTILCIHCHLWKHNPYKVGGFNEFEDDCSFCRTPVQLSVESLGVFDDLAWPELSAYICCAWLCGKNLNADSGPADRQHTFHQEELGGFQFSWRAASVAKSKKLTQRLIRKKRRNARELRSLHFVPLASVLLLDITQVTCVKVYPQNRSCFCLTRRP